MSRQRTILLTFAGRRDRMQLLTRYAAAAIDAGLIDEWHVWDFTRTREDAAWLREIFPVVQTTPSHTLEYFRAPHPLELRDATLRTSLQVRAPSDVHIGLRRTSGIGPSYELVLGGWGNAISAIRTFADGEQLKNVATREAESSSVQHFRTPALMPEYGFSSIDIDMGPDGLAVTVNGAVVLRDATPVEPGNFDLLYRTGYGANGDWRFPGIDDAPARLFVCGPERHHPATAMFYTRAYQHYVAMLDQHRDDVFLKCDDDIVHFDLQRLAEFIAFRKSHPEFFLVSANVVNNGVCAHFQQQAGLIAPETMECELPPGGMCGTVWGDGDKAGALHRLFLANPSAFQQTDGAPIVWNERISINFVAFLGRDIAHIPDLMADDEHDLCYGVRKRARKSNCIYPGFVAAHLSFWKQDASMPLPELLESYETLADESLASFIDVRSPASDDEAPAPLAIAC
jgi:hypothetical protein